jgi:multidrug efflux pump subunit AcrA (membrane-fusion protein)
MAVVVTAIVGVLGVSSATQATQAAQEPPPTTAQVTKGKLAAMVSLDGTLTYRARSDGSPYAVTNQAVGRYTELPDEGDKVDCGDVLYRVDNKPVLLLCGTVPAYRDLHYGYVGTDVGQLNRNLHTLGYDAKAGVAINPDDNAFTWMTDRALKALQHDRGANATGELYLEDAVFLPESVQIAKVTVQLAATADPGAPVLSATSDTLDVQANLDPSQQGEVKEGDSAQITLPGNKSVTGKVERLGRVAQTPAGQNNNTPAAATIPAYISLDDPAAARGLDKAPVQVDITTDGVESALSVPVIALVGKTGGGFAVEVVRDDGRRELVPVELGLFDSTDGRVQVDGDVAEGDRVVVPSP